MVSILIFCLSGNLRGTFRRGSAASAVLARSHSEIIPEAAGENVDGGIIEYPAYLSDRLSLGKQLAGNVHAALCVIVAEGLAGDFAEALCDIPVIVIEKRFKLGQLAYFADMVHQVLLYLIGQHCLAFYIRRIKRLRLLPAGSDEKYEEFFKRGGDEFPRHEVVGVYLGKYVVKNIVFLLHPEYELVLSV